MKNSNFKKLNLKKHTVSNLQLKQVRGGVHDSCTPDCDRPESEGICFPTQHAEFNPNM